MKTYIICCVPEQIPYVGKFLFLRCRPKCSQPIRLLRFLNVDTELNKSKVDQKNIEVRIVENRCGQSDHWTLKLTVCQ